jgi:hypothetical protein
VNLKFIYKLIFSGFIAFAVIITIIIFLDFMYIPRKIESEVKSASCIGTVVEIKKDQPCSFIVRVKELTEIKDLNLMSCCGTNDSLFQLIEINDSLIKEKDKMSLTVIKANTHNRKIFQYPFCIE